VLLATEEDDLKNLRMLFLEGLLLPREKEEDSGADDDDDDDDDVDLVGLVHAMLEGKDTKKSDEATIPFVGEERFDGGVIVGDGVDGSVDGAAAVVVVAVVVAVAVGGDDWWDDEEDGTMTITSRAVPVAEPYGAEDGGGDIIMLEESDMFAILLLL